MIHDKYTITGIGEICYHLSKYKDCKEAWQVDFFNCFDQPLVVFESDEETITALQDEDETYTMVTLIVDLAMSMGRQY